MEEWVEVQRVNSREIPQRWLDDRRERVTQRFASNPNDYFQLFRDSNDFRSASGSRPDLSFALDTGRRDNSRLRKHIALSTSDMYVCRMFVKSWHGRWRFDSNTCIRTSLIKVLNGRDDRLRRIGSKCPPLIFIRSCRMVARKSLLFCIKYWVEYLGFYVKYWVASCM